MTIGESSRKLQYILDTATKNFNPSKPIREADMDMDMPLS